MQSESEFITGKQVAVRLGRTAEWVRKARKVPGLGPPWYRVGRRYLYRPQELMSWLRGCRSC